MDRRKSTFRQLHFSCSGFLELSQKTVGKIKSVGVFILNGTVFRFTHKNSARSLILRSVCVGERKRERERERVTRKKKKNSYLYSLSQDFDTTGGQSKLRKELEKYK